VPRELQIDKFDGTSWVSVVPFRMEGVSRRPFQPAAGSIDAAGLVAPHGLSLPVVPPLLHFAPGVDVVVWSPQRAGG